MQAKGQIPKIVYWLMQLTIELTTYTKLRYLYVTYYLSMELLMFN